MLFGDRQGVYMCFLRTTIKKLLLLSMTIKLTSNFRLNVFWIHCFVTIEINDQYITFFPSYSYMTFSIAIRDYIPINALISHSRRIQLN